MNTFTPGPTGTSTQTFTSSPTITATPTVTITPTSVFDFGIVDPPLGTNPEAETLHDTLNITTAGICTVTGDSATDTLAFSCTEVDGSITNEIQNLY